jgi:hypothetical protein
LGEHGAGGGESEIGDQVLSQQPHRDCIEQQHPLAGKPDHPAFRVQLQQLLVIKIADAHHPCPSV